MSILIKGVEMPQCCRDCACYHHRFDDGYYDFEICGASGTVFNDGYSSVTGHKTHIDPFKARLDDCPLVPVPPHGDLIDREETKRRLAEHLCKMKPPIMWPDWNDAVISICTAPAVIPAEEET